MVDNHKICLGCIKFLQVDVLCPFKIPRKLHTSYFKVNDGRSGQYGRCSPGVEVLTEEVAVVSSLSYVNAVA
jgi:hypothetical protein